MKICWFNEHRLGVVVNDKVHDVTDALKGLPAPSYPQVIGDLVVANLPQLRAQIERILTSTSAQPVSEVRFQSPVAQPGKIIGVPVNYQAHVEEAHRDVAIFTNRYTGGVKEQGLFLKANSSLIGCSDAVKITMPERLTHHEIELAAIIGRKVSNVSRDEALSCIAGYSIALDMTVRGPEDRSLRKSLDTYSVLGPWLVTADEISDPQKLDLHLTVNGETRQITNSSQMIMYIAEQIEWASSFYTLYPGDIIMTGTCEGVGPVVPGDVMHATIESIGDMRVRVEAAGA
ncbi:fumarylacetoacetate hydrolase family protein [Diaphorobacter ruginosibacter]|uniref:fumarylacetoacetate hydrolase family protein n=1 Tax=Diaphorobacter ruginosibacter TaxID=1715720 RepID=UPI0033414750